MEAWNELKGKSDKTPAECVLIEAVKLVSKLKSVSEITAYQICLNKAGIVATKVEAKSKPKPEPELEKPKKKRTYKPRKKKSAI
jgi:hypothetical protein